MFDLIDKRRAMLDFVEVLSTMECANGSDEIMDKLNAIYESTQKYELNSIEEVAEEVFWVYYNTINK